MRIATLSLLAVLMCTAPAAAQTLSVTVTTTPAGGNYNPRNIVAIWVEKSDGTFVKTIGRWANGEKASLLRWRSKAGTADADAVSGSTRSNHNSAITTVLWDLKDKTGALVPDGTYNVQMELADRNASSQSQNNQGTFSFTKGPSNSTQTGLTNGGFNAVTITFVAGAANTAPTVATAAAAVTATNKTSNLSVLGADNAGEASLTYTWASSPSGVTFSANGSNAAKSTVATFPSAGTFALTCTIADGGGLSVTSSVNVTVTAALTTLTLSPKPASTQAGSTLQFSAVAKDQFNATMTTPTLTWMTSGGGTINASGLLTASGTPGGPFTVTATSGAISGTSTLTVTAGSPPTIATAAAANPTTVTATTTALTVLGATTSGAESTLTYTWGKTSGPGSVTFAPNGTNAAKASTATFSQAGSYTLQVTVTDASQQTVTGTVNVTVSQTLTTLTASPASASVAVSGTQQYSCTGVDQFGAATTTQPTCTWAVTGTGTINASGLFTAPATAGGPFTVTATSGARMGTAQVTVTSGSPPTVATPAAANPTTVTTTSTALTVLGADNGGEAALTYSWSKASGPGSVTFTPNGNNASKASTATFSAPGNYTLTVTITDGTALSNTSTVSVSVVSTLTSLSLAPMTASLMSGGTQAFTPTGVDQFGASVGSIPTITWTVSGGGTITNAGLLSASTTAGGPFTVTATVGTVHGSATFSVTAMSPPTVATPAAASPATVTATSTNLSVLGAASSGESGLTYTWASTGPTTVTFSANGSNAAKATTATFTQPGSYPMTVTIAAPNGLTTTSSVTVTVVATLSSLTVAPGQATVATMGTQQFIANGVDQFSAAVTNVSGLTWALSNGCAGCSLSSTGLFTAGSSAGGPYTVTATSGSRMATASVSVAMGSPPTFAVLPVADDNPLLTTATGITTLGADVAGESGLIYSWTVSPPGPAISPNDSNAAKTTGVTFNRAGTYTFTVTIRNAVGLTTSASLPLEVAVSVMQLNLSPMNARIPALGTQQFSVTAADQFQLEVTPVPLVSWSAMGNGSMSPTGLFTAGVNAGAATVIAKAGGVTAQVPVEVFDPGTDTVPPDVKMLSPGEGANVTGTTLIRAAATDKGGVAKVVLRVDGSPIVELTTAPYELRFDTTTVTNGSHVVDAQAFDVAGNTAIAVPVNMNVNNGTTGKPAPGCSCTQIDAFAPMLALLVLALWRRRSATSFTP